MNVLEYVPIVAILFMHMNNYKYYVKRELTIITKGAYIVTSIVSTFGIIKSITDRPIDYVYLTLGVAILLLSLVVLWNDWRRGRKKKPKRVLGVVRNVGHRLEVVPVKE